MNRILLIRHGSTDLMGRVLYGRMPGVRLNAAGEEQARRLAAGLARDYTIDALISSPMERALETARPIGEALGCEIRIDEKISEIDVGSWLGRSFEELGKDQDWKNFNRRRSLCSPPGGESMLEVQARAWECVSEYIEAPTVSTAAFVTHGDVIRGLILLLLGMGIDDIHRLEIAPASLTEFVLGDHYPVLRRMNYSY
ncbi:MAG TPA: histidine phosphatase family protein [Bryobacteraceae bacterium]|nr:histidine phosphatase family protein [Bryobacteraceae bacterium]